MDMRFNTTVGSMKPHYIFMGFDLHRGGGEVGTLNEPRNSYDAYLMHFVTVFNGYFIVVCFVSGGSLTLQVGAVHPCKATRFSLRMLACMPWFCVITPLTFGLAYNCCIPLNQASFFVVAGEDSVATMPFGKEDMFGYLCKHPR